MPSLESLHQSYKDKPFAVVLINVREAESRVRTFLAAKKITFPVPLDEIGLVSKEYGVKSFPAKFLLDHRGEIIAVERGYRVWDNSEMHTLIDVLLRNIDNDKMP